MALHPRSRSTAGNRSRRLTLESLEDRRVMAANLQLVADLAPGPDSSSPALHATVGNDAFFIAGGNQLWKTNGTAGGTVHIKDIDFGGEHELNIEMVAMGDNVYFAATDPTHGWSLWKSDGTAKGTQLVKAFDTGTQTSKYFGPNELVNVNGVLYFRANDGVSGFELWRSDGTEAGTQMVLDIYPGSSGFPEDLTDVNGTLYFRAGAPESGAELWRSDGTAAGTALVSDISPGPNSGNPRQLTNVGGTLFFTRTDSEHGNELWKSDGTSEGTYLVKDIRIGSDGANPTWLTDANGTLFFTADDGIHGSELWKSDGTSDGTVMVSNIPSGSVPLRADSVIAVGANIFFRADDGVNVIGLWKSNGTTAEPLPLADIVPDGMWSLPSKFISFAGKLHFRHEQYVPEYGGYYSQLAVSDGTAAGTTPLRGTPFHLKLEGADFSAPYVDLLVLGNKLLISADDGVHGRELWSLTYSNDRPVVDNLGADLTYWENAAPKAVAPYATVRDSDSPNFAGGKLWVQITENSEWPDRLTIRNTDLISTRGQEVLYAGQVIGTWVGGLGGGALAVTFNEQANPFRVQTVLRNIVYANISENPSSLPRTVRIQLTDGDGAYSLPLSKTINVVPVNDAAKITVASAPLGYQMNAASIAVMAEAYLSDADNANFADGKLVVRATEPDAANRLEIGGGFTVVNQQVLLGGVVIGTLSWQGGIGERNLAVTFNSEATVDRVQQLLRSIRFRTAGATTTTPRTLAVSLYDGRGAVTTVTKTVNLAP